MNQLGAFSRFALVYESVGIVTDLKCVLKSKTSGEPLMSCFITFKSAL